VDRPERAKNWATRGALGLASGRRRTTVAAAVRHLMVCTQAAEPAACTRTAVVAALPTPVADGPALDLTVRVDGWPRSSWPWWVSRGLHRDLLERLAADDPLRHSVAGSFNLRSATLLLATMVNNVFWLFVALELITLSSADLVRYRGRSHGPVRAGQDSDPHLLS
jgi:hypothetical protein